MDLILCGVGLNGVLVNIFIVSGLVNFVIWIVVLFIFGILVVIVIIGSGLFG